MHMLTLFYKPTCPYCQRVLGEAESMGITLQLKDISGDENVVNELIEKGGKKQVPFLHDDNGTPETIDDRDLYESNDIIAYLGEHYGGTGESKTEFNGLKIHRSDDACEVCE